MYDMAEITSLLLFASFPCGFLPSAKGGKAIWFSVLITQLLFYSAGNCLKHLGRCELNQEDYPFNT